MTAQTSPPSQPMHDVDDGGVRDLASRLANRVTQWLEDRRYLREHQRLVDDVRRKGEFEVLLEALDMTAEQFEASRVPPVVAAELSQRMLQQLGCESRISAIDLQAVTQRCRSCESWKTCRHWLDRGEPGGAYREFCVNAEVFDQLRGTPPESR
ncbi:MAG TPA: DUF6455 family protein [Casimicrobiaceae bacterium]|nr:DUF6455 family protein [Casimicrobiaceae bacterium]